MISEALRIRDENTVNYMMEENRKEIESRQKEIEENDKELEDEDAEIERLKRLLSEGSDV